MRDFFRRTLDRENRIGLLVAGVISLALLYTLILLLFSRCNIVEWLNTLIATVVSVFSALVIGILLYRYQTTENDRKEREELRGDVTLRQRRSISQKF